MAGRIEGRRRAPRTRAAAILAAGALAIGLLGTGCSSTTEDTSTGSSGGGPGSTSGDTATGEPITIVLLSSTAGESEQAVADYADGVELAVEQLNGIDGIDGRRIREVRIPLPADAEGARAALERALGEDPAVIIGFPLSSTIADVAEELGASGVPTLLLSSQPAVLADSGTTPLPNAFTLRPSTASAVTAMTTYAVDELGAGTVGLVCTEGELGDRWCAAANEALAESDATVVAELRNPADATDMGPLLDQLGEAELIVNFNFPIPLGASVRHLAARGDTRPMVDGASAELVARDAGPEESAWLDQLYGWVDCVPADDDRALAQTFETSYTDRFGSAPTQLAAMSYDAVLVATAAIEEAGTDAAGSTDHGAIVHALEQVTVEGVCDPSYHADADHVMNDSAVAVSFPDGTITPRAELDLGAGSDADGGS